MKISLFIVLFFSFVAGFALLRPGLPPTHDGEYHVIRFYEFDKVLRDGNFYPRWAPDLNYGLGVPLFNYVYPFPNYFASFLHLFNFSFIDAFKLIMFFATIVGAFFFYFWARIFWGNLGGIVSSVFYTFSPYHFLDIYIRGSVGEVWALAFFPAFLWSITKFIKEKNKKYGAFSSIFLALTIFSHNILSVMFFTFALFYILLLIFQSKDRKFLILYSLFIVLLGLGLSSIFWLPALLESKYVTGLQIYNIEENFPDLYQLFIPSWGSGFSVGDLQNQMSFQIGLANLLAIFLSIFSLIILWKRKDNNSKLIVFFLVSFSIVFFLMLKVSLPVWKIIPVMNYFQFPWRFLSLEILIASFLAGSIFGFWAKKSLKTYTLAIFMILLATGLGFNYAKPAYYHYRSDNYYTTRANFIYGTNSVGDYFNTVWAKKAIGLQKRKLQENVDVRIFSESIKTTDYKFDILAKKDSKINVNTAYFPGWEAFINGKKIPVEPGKNGLVSFFVPQGRYLLEVKFGDTFVRTIAKYMLLISIGCFSVLLINNSYVKIIR